MKILFTSTGREWDSQVDSRFGRSNYLLLFDNVTNSIEVIDNRENSDRAHGVGTKTAQIVYNLAPDVLITGNGPGENASIILDRMNIKIYVKAGGLSIEEAYSKFKENKLELLN